MVAVDDGHDDGDDGDDDTVAVALAVAVAVVAVAVAVAVAVCLAHLLKVRFIEAAIVCPVWTSLICYYLEEERGHLMKEGMHAARHRIGVRGNNFSLLTPWKDILDSLHRELSRRQCL